MDQNKKYCYEYPRPMLACDCAVVAKVDEHWEVLLIERKHDPYKGMWAVPGGFMEMDETTEDAAIRELKEETGIEVESVEQVNTFSAVNRDPRGRVITILYMAYVDKKKVFPKASDDAKNVQWFSFDQLPPLAFDHDDELGKVIQKLK